ncbi:MAG: metal-sensitive transcriptional regulator [Acidobacteriota bacterium]|nr:metal-sensitive transcriptional regulator [Acidobacteriota bacterium]MDE3108253.1 metal-sensitive transcriptional regulator [Acidobacteriota bacterium]MDE3222348.1 metal-sensitive transcriptional regulator [Acidobacteriota bacterium]
MTTHVLQDTQTKDAISKRLRRAHGQLGAVIRMLDDGRDCQEIVTQMAAVDKAVTAAAFTLISTSLRECFADPTRDEVDVTNKLQKLFLSMA